MNSTASQLEFDVFNPAGLYLVECSNQATGDRKHLRCKDTVKSKNGVYEMRVRVLNLKNPAMLGPRLHFSLRTKSIEEARIRRDIVLKALELAEAIN